MRPSRRYGVNKGKSAKHFRNQTRRTAGHNMRGLKRGGWRL